MSTSHVSSSSLSTEATSSNMADTVSTDGDERTVKSKLKRDASVLDHYDSPASKVAILDSIPENGKAEGEDTVQHPQHSLCLLTTELRVDSSNPHKEHTKESVDVSLKQEVTNFDRPSHIMETGDMNQQPEPVAPAREVIVHQESDSGFTDSESEESDSDKSESDKSDSDESESDKSNSEESESEESAPSIVGSGGLGDSKLEEEPTTTGLGILKDPVDSDVDEGPQKCCEGSCERDAELKQQISASKSASDSSDVNDSKDRSNHESVTDSDSNESVISASDTTGQGGSEDDEPTKWPVDTDYSGSERYSDLDSEEGWSPKRDNDIDSKFDVSHSDLYAIVSASSGMEDIFRSES